MSDGLQLAKKLLSNWMLEQGFATGHGDTFEDLLTELAWQIEELRKSSGTTLSAKILPSDVMVPPRTIIRAGCKFSTLLKALDVRKDLGLRFDSRPGHFKEAKLSDKDYEENLLQHGVV